MNDKFEQIITTVEENLDYEDKCYHSDNCEVSGLVRNRVEVKKWIGEILAESPDYHKAYDILMEYWDSLPDEEKEKIHKRLQKVGC